MGIIPGTRIKLLRKSRGQIIVLASDTRVALGKGQAEKILVKRESYHEAQGEPQARRSLLVAFAGQPNVGKTTVFNLLTGLSQHIGNWPGKTVERKEGIHRAKDTEIRLVDLPGTYSLSSYSEEERVTREFLIHEHPDITVLFVNASALERSLYLLTELLLLRSPVIVAVNMLDVAENQGVHIDAEALEASLGLPVVSTVATKNRGIKELLEEILKVAETPGLYKPKIPRVTQDHHDIYLKISELIRDHVPVHFTVEWVVTKLMEGDSEVTETFQGIIPRRPGTKYRPCSLPTKMPCAPLWGEGTTGSRTRRVRRVTVQTRPGADDGPHRPCPDAASNGYTGTSRHSRRCLPCHLRRGIPSSELPRISCGVPGLRDRSVLEREPQWIKGLLVDGIIGGAGSVLTFVPYSSCSSSPCPFWRMSGTWLGPPSSWTGSCTSSGFTGRASSPCASGSGAMWPPCLERA
jgi:ferrous iron transport protein B